jgi:hypothetical protein
MKREESEIVWSESGLRGRHVVADQECMWKGAGCSGSLVEYEDTWICERHLPTGNPLPEPGAKARSDEALKFDKGKLRMELIDPVVLEALSRILTGGAIKYGAFNWAKGFEWSRVYGALLRHLNDWYNRKDTDPETGESHLHHAMCNIAFLISHETRGLGTDDRPFAVLSSSRRLGGDGRTLPPVSEVPGASALSKEDPCP